MALIPLSLVPLLVGVTLAGAPAARVAVDSTRPAIAADSASVPSADESRAVAMARASTSRSAATAARTAARPDLSVAAERPARRVLPSPTFRRRINGRLIADSVVVEKAARKMTLFYRGDSVAVFLVALGRNPAGHKERQGDGRTPEGLYRIDARNAASQYHLSLHVSYPSAADRARAARQGVGTGGNIMIHGLPPAFANYGAGHRAWDWTEGCIALTDSEIEEVYSAVRLGAAIEIKP
jgi:hypothetical protein